MTTRRDIREGIEAARRELYLAGRNDALRSVPAVWRNAADAIASEPAPRAVTEHDVDAEIARYRRDAGRMRFDVATIGEGWSDAVKRRWLTRALELEARADALDREAAE